MGLQDKLATGRISPEVRPVVLFVNTYTRFNHPALGGAAVNSCMALRSDPLPAGDHAAALIP